MEKNDFERFEFINPLSDLQKATFLPVMETMLLNLDIRFPCPSLSIDLSLAKQNMDNTTNTLKPEFYKQTQMMCPFVMEVDLFNSPDRFIRERRVNPYFLRVFLDMAGLLKEIVENERLIAEYHCLSKGKTQELNESIITLFEVFKVVDKMKYPELCDIVLRVLSYMPTSVGCEQSFCILKRRMHENMKKENGFLFDEMAKTKKVIEL